MCLTARRISRLGLPTGRQVGNKHFDQAQDFYRLTRLCQVLGIVWVEGF
jgi:hypothetical protein